MLHMLKVNNWLHADPLLPKKEYGDLHKVKKKMLDFAKKDLVWFDI